MIINVMDRGFKLGSCRVFLDGRDVSGCCFYADDQVGYVGLYVTEDVPGAKVSGEGPRRRAVKDGKLLTFGVTGNVVIERV